VPDALAFAYRECHLLTAKPVLFVANVDEAALAEGNHYSAVLEEHAHKTGAEVVRICGQVEAELSELDDADKQEFLESRGASEPGLDRLIRAAYTLLDLITFFTAGEKEVRAWTVRRGALAPEAAGEIHSDFEHSFIRAEVIPFETYVELGGEAGAKSKGRMQVEGKEYLVVDGDVMHFRVGV
jgi:ribosome-binding ATPase YchF (GTP1/OBG family)